MKIEPYIPKWMVYTVTAGTIFLVIALLIGDTPMIIAAASLTLIGVICLTGEKVINRLEVVE